MKKFYYICFAEAPILGIYLAIRFIAPYFPLQVEQFYSQRFFVWLNAPFVWLSSLIDFSFAPAYVVALASLLLVSIVTLALLLIKRKFSGALALVVGLLLFAGSQYVVMYANWGLNYYRMPISYALNLPKSDRSPELLVGLCAELAAMAEEVREGLPENPDGTAAMLDEKSALDVKAEYIALDERFGAFPLRPIKVKPLVLSEVFNYIGITGIYFPFTRDANANTGAHPLLVSATAMHEAAHLTGVGAEDEANFVGFLACMHSQRPEVRYSGLMLALISAGNELNAIAPEVYGALRGSYSDKMNRDLDSYNKFWQKYEGKAQEVTDKVNDSYLKSNGQEHGTASYGMMTNLLLDAYAAGTLVR